MRETWKEEKLFCASQKICKKTAKKRNKNISSPLLLFFTSSQYKLAWLKTWRKRGGSSCWSLRAKYHHEGKRDMPCFVRRWLLLPYEFSRLRIAHFSTTKKNTRNLENVPQVSRERERKTFIYIFSASTRSQSITFLSFARSTAGIFYLYSFPSFAGLKMEELFTWEVIFSHRAFRDV